MNFKEDSSIEDPACSSAFDSKFLSMEMPAMKGFLSKDTLPDLDQSLFQSRDSFSSMFKSSDWKQSFQLAPVVEEAKAIKKEQPTTEEKGEIAEDNTKEQREKNLCSKDWLTSSALGNHVDVSYSEVFNGDTTVPDKASSANQTNWNSLYFAQLKLPGSQEVASRPNDSKLEASVTDEASYSLASRDVNSSARGGKKKRSRKPRKKVVPSNKKYVEPNDNDVLMGRGGRSNHHPGNKRYRNEVQNLREWYSNISDKDQKTDLSQCLVDYVHDYQGRFLEHDDQGWYIVPNLVARRKASQALREDNDPKKRAAKRERYLRKKAAENLMTGTPGGVAA